MDGHLQGGPRHGLDSLGLSKPPVFWAELVKDHPSSGFLGSRAIPGGVSVGIPLRIPRVVLEQKGKEVISEVP